MTAVLGPMRRFPAGWTCWSKTSVLVQATTFSYAARINRNTHTAAAAFFEALSERGVKAVFANLGSDHPAVIEAMVQGQRNAKSGKGTFPKIYTCPNELVAISAADGYARVTNRPQAVIVHTDVGTQSLSCGLHNSSIGRAPVFIFSGMCPSTEDGTIRGHRTEYMHWLQEPHDQKAIVSQYCRYAGELKTARSMKQMVHRAMQFAESDPKGPAYICATREVLEEELDAENGASMAEYYTPIKSAALPQDAVELLASELVHAESPLLITGFSGRDRSIPGELERLANNIPGLRISDTGGSDVCISASHPSYTGMMYSSDPSVSEADLILTLECPVPWIPARNSPNFEKGVKIYHIDSDPLNGDMPNSFFPANQRWQVSSLQALQQINKFLEANESLRQRLQSPVYEERRQKLLSRQKVRQNQIAAAAEPSASSESYNTAYLGSLLRKVLPPATTYVVEAVTNATILADQLAPERPGSWLNCGGTGLGWSGGAALGVKLALDAQQPKEPNLVVQIVGDGTYMATVPSSVYWIASRYGIPFITIVLNNGGWNAPRNSLELVHPNGLGANSSNEEINISFEPTPLYAEIAKAAGGRQFDGKDGSIYAKVATMRSGLKVAIGEAVEAVRSGRGAVIEARVEK